eukprot:165806-Chlamydomonas_euryale.AAC.2
MQLGMRHAAGHAPCSWTGTMQLDRHHAIQQAPCVWACAMQLDRHHAIQQAPCVWAGALRLGWGVEDPQGGRERSAPGSTLLDFHNLACLCELHGRRCWCPPSRGLRACWCMSPPHDAVAHPMPPHAAPHTAPHTAPQFESTLMVLTGRNAGARRLALCEPAGAQVPHLPGRPQPLPGERC